VRTVLQRYRTHQVFEAMVQTQHSIQINRGHCVTFTNGKKMSQTPNPPLGSIPGGVHTHTHCEATDAKRHQRAMRELDECVRDDEAPLTMYAPHVSNLSHLDASRRYRQTAKLDAW